MPVDPAPHPEITADEQAQYLEAATEAGLRGDAHGMLEALVRSRVLDGLRHQLLGAEQNEPNPADADLVDQAIGLGTDAALVQLISGKRLSSIAAYINRCSQTILGNLKRASRSTDGQTHAHWVEEEDCRAMPGSVLDALTAEPPLVHEAVRREAFVLVRRLLPRLGQTNVQAVMELILEAAEQHQFELGDLQIAETLGLTVENAKKARQRGFQRLTRVVDEEGLGRQALKRLREEGFVESTDPNEENHEGY